VNGGESIPLHKHDKDMEPFYVLEGEVSFYLGGQSGQRAVAGAFVSRHVQLYNL
jgi:quercetin dioxygenase-like cupin family protein